MNVDGSGRRLPKGTPLVGRPRPTETRPAHDRSMLFIVQSCFS